MSKFQVLESNGGVTVTLSVQVDATFPGFSAPELAQIPSIVFSDSAVALAVRKAAREAAFRACEEVALAVSDAAAETANEAELDREVAADTRVREAREALFSKHSQEMETARQFHQADKALAVECFDSQTISLQAEINALKAQLDAKQKRSAAAKRGAAKGGRRG